MKIDLKKWQKSNYDITLIFDQHDKDHGKEHALQHIQKDFDFKGFRKGHVPMDIVKQQTNPEYLEMMATQDLVNHWLDQLVNDHKDIKWIWEPQDINPSKENPNELTFSLDFYPEVEEKDAKFKKEHIEKYETEVSDKELDEAVVLLRKQFATYENREEMTLTTTSRVKLVFKDKEWAILDTKFAYVNDTDYAAHQWLDKIFVGKKMNEVFTIDYSVKLPEIVQFTKEGKPETIEITVVAVQEAILPEINEEFIKKTFWTEEVKNEADVREKVKEIIVENKKEAWLTNAIDGYLGKIKDSFDVQIPQTLVNHEVDHRVKKLIEQFGGEENFKRYIQQRGEEEVQKLTESITVAANQSLERYFIFKKVIEVNELEVDWEKALDAESQLYDKLAK